MATQKIIIEAVNKTGAALGKIQNDLKGINTATNSLSSGFSRLQTLIVGAAAAFGGLKVASGFLDTARQLENLGIQLKFITGSAEEGAKALNIVKSAAANSAFQLAEMAQASPLLLTVADSTEELNELLAITGDLAVASGLDFVTTAEQIQRSFSGGIAAADLFRERGIKALLGFQEGVQFSAEETKRIITEGFENGAFAIAGAAAEMATSFDGAVSMLQDGLFQFQAQVMDSGPFEMLKSTIALAVEAIGDNFGSIQDAATGMGQKIVSVVEGIVIGFGVLLDAISPVFKFVRSSVNGLVEFTNALPPTIKTLGIIGFLALGLKGKIIVATIGLVIDNVQTLFSGFLKFVGNITRKIANAAEAIGLDSLASKMRGFADDITNKADQLGEDLKKTITTLDDLVNTNIGKIPGFPEPEAMGKYETLFRGFLGRIQQITDERYKKQQEQDETAAEAQVQTQQEALSKEQQILEKKLIQLQEALMSEVETIENTRKKQLDIIEKNLKEQIITEQEAQDLRVKVNAEADEKINAFKQQALDEATAQTKKALEMQAKAEEALHDLKVELYNTEEDNIRDAYANRLKIVEDALNQEIIAEAEAAKIKADLNKKMAAEIAKINKEAARERRIEALMEAGRTKEQAESLLEFENKTNAEKSIFAIQKGKETFEALGTMNRKAFQAYKAFAIAEAIVSTYQGAAKALGAFPPPFNFIAAAAVIAQGFAQVNQIKSANYSGRQMGGPVGAGQTYMVGERGPETFRAPAGGGTIIPNGQGGGVNVNFTVNAIDAQSFNSALSRQRNTIVGIVNEAVNNTGRRAITAY
tara:strand:+ start:11009 stop:13456 length:2448 start_codon:yes stop_codon:yes gene_type:complete